MVFEEYLRIKVSKPHGVFAIGLRIPITIPPAKLQDSGFSTFKEIYRKPLHVISDPTVDFHKDHIQSQNINSQLFSTATQNIMIFPYKRTEIFIKLRALVLISVTYDHTNIIAYNIFENFRFSSRI